MQKRLLPFLRSKGKAVVLVCFLLCSLFSFAQQKLVVTGTVVAEDNVPLADVSVSADDGSAGTITDGEGKFTIQVIKGVTLIISNVSYEAQRIKVAKEGTIGTIMLVPQNSVLSDVVVVGYGTQKKVNLTGAISSVDSKVLESRPITNIGQGLQGHIANFNINPGDGGPGKGATFNVRGYTSINGGGPLILVNGIPMDVNILNPADVENVTVLKDAAASAIYGARAAYGVILITTKSGSKGSKPKVSVTSNYSINSPVVKLEMMDSMERLLYMNAGNINSSGQPWGEFDQYGEAAIKAHYNDPTQPELFTHPSNPGVWMPSANTDWARELLRNNFPMQQYTASVSGGSDKFNYYTSFSYFNQKGIAKHFNENFNRYNLMTNLNYKLARWVSIGSKVSVNISDKKYPPNNSSNQFPEQFTGFMIYAIPSVPIYTPDGNWYQYGSIPNMVQMRKEGGYRTRDVNNVWLTANMKLTPVRNTSINIDYSYGTNISKELDYRRQLPKYDKNGFAGYYPFTNPSSVTRTNIDEKRYVLNAYADYENNFGLKHYFKAMAGVNHERALYNSFQGTRRNLILGTIPYVSLATGEMMLQDAASEFAILGIFGRLNYSYDDKYLLEFNSRYDGTSKFPRKNRFALFPSVSVGWRLDKEAFFGDLKNTVSLLKIRASYGSLGNQNVPGDYPYIATLGSGQVNYLFNGERDMTVYAPGLVSPALTWEKVNQKNIGLDFGLLSNRLTGSFDLYRRDTKDMLTKAQTLPAVLAVSEPQQNAADLKTTGFDLTLGWRDQLSKFSYGVTLILSDYTSKITKFDNPRGLIADYYVGKSIGEIWGFETGGIFQTNEEAAALDQTQISGRPRAAGDLWFKDLDKDGKITRGDNTLSNSGDQKVIGNSTPRYSYGLRTEFAWKGFDLEVFLQGVAKRDAVLHNEFYLNAWNNPHWSPIFKQGLDYWSSENRDALYPRPWVGQANDVTTPQTRYLQDAAYLRLKQLTLGYSIPANMIQKLKLQNIRLYVSGNNIGVLTKMIKISDPEQNGSIYYPLNKSFSVGANFTF